MRATCDNQRQAKGVQGPSLACVFDRPERTIGASGGERSVNVTSLAARAGTVALPETPGVPVITAPHEHRPDVGLVVHDEDMLLGGIHWPTGYTGADEGQSAGYGAPSFPCGWLSEWQQTRRAPAAPNRRRERRRATGLCERRRATVARFTHRMPFGRTDSGRSRGER